MFTRYWGQPVSHPHALPRACATRRCRVARTPPPTPVRVLSGSSAPARLNIRRGAVCVYGGRPGPWCQRQVERGIHSHLTASCVLLAFLPMVY
ncbi:hypothetical protein J6590_024868 [Homalodisca vitripennis]|nr:hypothetical protein J6590_024868 [Homalodisca vitripennis]